MAIERKKATGFLVFTGRTTDSGREQATYLNKVQFDRAWNESLTKNSQTARRLPDPTTALRIVALYGRST